LCGKSIGSVRSSTIGYERRHNHALQVADRDSYIAFATTDLPEQPGNHKRIKAINRRGPRPLGTIKPRPVGSQEAVAQFRQGAVLLDARSKEAFKARHIPGAVHLEADTRLSQRVGYVLPPDAPIVLMIESEADYHPVVLSLARVGYDNVVGYLADNLTVWEALGLPTTTGHVQDISASELNALLGEDVANRPVVVDVREAWEYAEGHVPGALLVPLGQLSQRLQELDRSKAVAVICASGGRSQSAAALLGQKQFDTVYNVVGGTFGWMQQGFPVERAQESVSL
jgi:hydroxyacylglutathione hydrolase